jgi:sugar (pentulose or hexulose) kinase
MDVGEPGCLGAAMLAGMATGAYKNERQAVSRVVRRESILYPDPGRTALYETQRNILNRAYEALEPVLTGGG